MIVKKKKEINKINKQNSVKKWSFLITYPEFTFAAKFWWALYTEDRLLMALPDIFQRIPKIFPFISWNSPQHLHCQIYVF